MAKITYVQLHMNIKFHLLLIIQIIAAAGCLASVKEQPVVMVKSHPVFITGVVKSIYPIDVDKRGKNPEIILHFNVKIIRHDDGGWDKVLGPEIKCVIKEKDLLEQTRKKLYTGDIILITAHIIEKNPKVIAAHTLEFLDQERDNVKTE